MSKSMLNSRFNTQNNTNKVNNMKMKAKHFNHMQRTINKFLLANLNIIEQYENGRFPRADRVNDLNVRFQQQVIHKKLRRHRWNQ